MARKLLVEVIGDTSGLEHSLRNASNQASGFGSTMGKVGHLVGAALEGMGIGAAVVGVASAKLAMDFQKHMGLIQTQAGASAGEVDKMSKSVLGLAHAGAQQGPKQLADALFHIESVGYRGAKALDVLKLASEGAAVGNSDLEDTTKALVHAMQSHIAGAENATKAMSTLNAIVGQGDMRMQDLASSMGTGILNAAAGAGSSLQDVGAAIGVLTSKGTEAVAASTGLRSSLAMMEDPTTKSAKALATLGINAQQLGKMIQTGPGGLVSAIELLHAKLQDATPAERARAILEIFSKKAGQSMVSLINNANDLRKRFEAVGSTASQFNTDVAVQAAESSAKIKAAWASVQASMIEMGAALLPAIANVASFVSEVLAAKGLSMKIHVVLDGLEDVAKKLDTFLFGTTIHIRGMDFGGMETVQTQGLVDKIAQAMGRVNWVGVGTAIAKGINQGADAASTESSKGGTSLGNRLVDGFNKALANPIGISEAAGKLVLAIAIPLGKISLLPVTFMSALETAIVKRFPEIAVNAATAANKVGVEILHGIGSGIAAISSVVYNKLAAIGTAINNVASSAFNWAMGIGSEIINGIVSGLGGLIGRVGGAIADKVGSAISYAYHHVGSTADAVAADQIGKPLAAGIVEGFLLGWANYNLPAKISAKLQAALQAAQQTIQGMEGNLAGAFTRLADYGLKAFDAETTRGLARILAHFDAARARIDAAFAQGGGETAAERSLREMQEQHDEAVRQKAIADAQAALDAAQAGGDPTAILAAQQALDDALYAEAVAQAQKLADQSRKAADDEAAKQKANLDAQQAEQDKQYQARRDLQRQNLEDMLNELEASLEKHPGKWKKIHADLIKLLGTFGVTFRQAGKDLGDSFATGMEDAFEHVEHTAKAIAELVAKYLPHSPAEEGPLSKLPDWEGYLTAGLSASGSTATRLLGASMAGGMGGGGSMAGAGGGGVTVNVIADGYVTDVRKLALDVRNQLKLLGFRNVDVGLA